MLVGGIRQEDVGNNTAVRCAMHLTMVGAVASRVIGFARFTVMVSAHYLRGVMRVATIDHRRGIGRHDCDRQEDGSYANHDQKGVNPVLHIRNGNPGRSGWQVTKTCGGAVSVIVA